MMLKQNKGKIVVTTLITLVPMLIGCLLWEQLPDTIAVHFGTDNTANGWSSKAGVVFGMPIFLMAIHLICLVMVSADPKKKNIGKKAMDLIFWFVPLISLCMINVIYAIALGINVNIQVICFLMIGVLFIFMGNQLPKVRQNYTYGIKLPWTLDDEENWRRTHRLAGWCMTLAGVITVVSAFWGAWWWFFLFIGAAVLIPILYSFLYYLRNQKKAE